MGKPAARITDLHTCPMVTGIVPHVGGPVIGPGVPTVLIGKLPAAVMGDMCTCVGPPDTILMGSATVMIGGKPAARLGDMTSHGGLITLGCPTVLIGDAAGGGGSSTGMSASIHKFAKAEITSKLSGVEHATSSQIAAMKKAAKEGSPLVHNSVDCPVCSGKSS
jgi:uncharacterized Zn-binding protein involved in type VI secretion